MCRHALTRKLASNGRVEVRHYGMMYRDAIVKFTTTLRFIGTFHAQTGHC